MLIAEVVPAGELLDEARVAVAQENAVQAEIVQRVEPGCELSDLLSTADSTEVTQEDQQRLAGHPLPQGSRFAGGVEYLVLAQRLGQRAAHLYLTHEAEPSKFGQLLAPLA